jgi:putative heme-binding domain-containing protein
MWRARSEKALPFITDMIKTEGSLDQKLAYFRALDFIPGEGKHAVLTDLISNRFKNDPASQLVALRHVNLAVLQSNPAAKKTLLTLMAKTNNELDFLELVEKYELTEATPKLLKMILEGKQTRKAGQVIYKLKGGSEIIEKTFRTGNETVQRAIIESIRWQGKNESLNLLNEAMSSEKYSLAIQREAARSLGNSLAGENFVLEALKGKKVPEKFIPSVVESVSRTYRKAVKAEAASYLSAGQKSASAIKHPALTELVAIRGNAKDGLKTFINACSMCHQVYNEGIDFGPKLTEIGSKLSREGLYLSILHPNAGIGFGYETFELKTKSGDTYQGIVVSKNETDVMLKLPGGSTQSFKTSALKSMKQLPDSLMPEGLADQMNTQEFTNLIEYLATLKKK